MKRHVSSFAFAAGLFAATAASVAARADPATESSEAEDPYVATSGTQYFLTDFCASPTTKAVLDFQMTVDSSQQRFFGSDFDGSEGLFSFSFYRNGSGQFAWAAQNNSGNWTSTGIAVDTKTRYTFTLDSYKNAYDLRVTGSSVATKSAALGTSRTQTAKYPLALAADNRGSSVTLQSRQRIYSFKLYSAGVLQRCYVPTWDSSRTGLVELVSGTFVTNRWTSGTAPLAVGGDLPSDLSPYVAGDDGVRWSTEKGRLELRLSVTGLYGAEVSVDGGAWTTSAEKWCPAGTVSTVSVRVPDGVAPTWLKCPAGAGKSEDGCTLTYTSSVPATVSVRAGDVLTWNSNDTGTYYWDDATKWTCSDGVTHRVPEAYDDAIINDRTSAVFTYSTIVVTNSTPRLGRVYLGARRWITMKNWDTKFSAREIVLWGTTDYTYGYHDNASSRFTCPGGFSDTTMSNRVWIVAEDLILSNAYAYINCNGAGYAKQNGPAWNTTSKWSGACAPHGGYGSTGGGTLYGSIKEPTEPGSGPYSTSSYAYPGGGAVRVEATNVVVNGSICTTGNSSSYGWGGGSSSGGSVYISCRTISGTGSVTANGGGNTSSNGSGAGGGGRVSVVYDPVAQSNVTCNLAFSARGGTDQSGDTVRYAGIGGSGSVYFSDRQMLDRPGRHVAGWVYTGPDVTLVNTLAGENMALTNSLVEIGAGGAVDVKGNLSFYGTNTRVNGLRTSGGRVPISVGGDLTLTGARLNVDGGGSVVVGGKFVMSDCAKATVSGEVRIRAAPTNGVDQAYGATLDIGGRWRMGQYAAYYPVCDSTNGSIVAATAGSLVMDATALMNANSAGYRCCYGPGRGSSASGHGGKGGNGFGSVYGNKEWPLRAGSGNNSSKYGLSGGGVIYVTTRGKMALGGTISAKGGNSSGTNYGAGPGSGGSILLDCGGRITGPVTITAAGGNANGSGYGSGGGRIAIYHHGRMPGTNVVVTAAGGTCSSSSTSNYTWGCSGTVYWHRIGNLQLILR